MVPEVRNTLAVGVGLAVALAAATAEPSAARRLSLAGLIDGADRVVVARVVDTGSSFWGPDHRLIYTVYSFESEEEVAGDGPRRFCVVQPGGRVGRWTQRTSGYPSFREGERLLLFLRKRTRGYRVVGLSQGVFGFRRHDTREFVFQKLEGLSFPGDRGRPILMERPAATRRIHKLWQQRKAR